MEIHRYENNPVITPKDVKPHRKDFEVIGAFNAAVTKYKDEIILLLRVAERPISKSSDTVKSPVYNVEMKNLDVLEISKGDKRYDFSDPRVIKDNIKKDGSFKYLTSLSYIRIARSKDGKHFIVDDKPFIYPSNKFEAFGIEDPRVTLIDDTYYIYYSGVSELGVGEMMVKTKDFQKIEHCGMIFAPENKDIVIFPEKINGKYYALHRPVPKACGNPEIWIAESDNLFYWGGHRHLLGLRDGMWDNERMGAGAVPIKTERGWLELYHGAAKDNKYCMGAVLLDIDDPSKVVGRSEKPVLEPEADYEVEGFFGNVVFSCGALAEGDKIKMYYGVADTSIACAELNIKEILDSLRYYN